MVTVPQVVRLVCPGCGRALPTLDTDVAWACGTCVTGYELIDGQLVEHPLKVLALPDDVPHQALIYLPFWRLELSPTIDGGSAAAIETITTMCAGRPSWVRAFSLRGAFYSGDPGLALSEHRWQERFDSGSPPPCLGASLSSSAGAQVARWFVLARADRHHDISHLTLTTVLRSAWLTLVPLAIEEDTDRLALLHAPGSFRREALLALPDILHRVRP